jgi:hypothetical protein
MAGTCALKFGLSQVTFGPIDRRPGLLPSRNSLRDGKAGHGLFLDPGGPGKGLVRAGYRALARLAMLRTLLAAGAGLWRRGAARCRSAGPKRSDPRHVRGR